MMNKKIILAAALAFSSIAAHAQNIDEGKKMVQYGRYTTAKSILTPLSASNPLANYYLGLAEVEMENYDAAKAIFSKYPEDPANMAGMARVAFAQGNAAEGARLAKVVADKAKKKEWQPLLFAADALNYGGGDAQQAIDWYRAALAKNDNVDVRIGLGDAFLRQQGGGGEAMNNYEAAVAKEPKNSLGYSRIGSLWYAGRVFDSSLVNFARAKDADPQNPIPYSKLADAYTRVQKFDLAKQNIEEYLKLSDKTNEDEVRYMNILYLGKYYNEAAQKAQEVINSGVTKPGAYGILAYSQLELKDSANALNNARTYFAKQDPKRIGPADYTTFGRIFLANNVSDSAEAYFQKAIATDTAKDKAETYRMIAESFKNQKSTDGYLKAGQWYGRIIADNPDAAALDYYYWGFWTFYGQDYDNAAKAFQAMEAKYPDQPSATYWRGRVAAAVDKEGKTGAASEHFNKYLALPENEKFTRKPAELTVIYQYQALVAYNKGDKNAVKDYIQKLRTIDPNDNLAKQLEGFLPKMK